MSAQVGDVYKFKKVELTVTRVGGITDSSMVFWSDGTYSKQKDLRDEMRVGRMHSHPLPKPLADFRSDSHAALMKLLAASGGRLES